MRATSRNEPQQLDPRRLRAVDLLAVGKRAAEVADELAVNRTTVWRWRDEPAFQQELARRREELWTWSIDRMRGLLPRALDVVAEALDDGDGRTAMQLLKLLRVGDAASAVRNDSPTPRPDADDCYSLEAIDAQITRLVAEIEDRDRRPAGSG